MTTITRRVRRVQQRRPCRRRRLLYTNIDTWYIISSTEDVSRTAAASGVGVDGGDDDGGGAAAGAVQGACDGGSEGGRGRAECSGGGGRCGATCILDSGG